ncbi:YnbE family lipoprotein [Candidatus Phaeomarinobacter ectocarpi]|nr:YnbE family lipoprotein [Candidatus Phaeomarinobacter ectocarpi]
MSNAQSNADVIFRHGASRRLPVIAGLLALGVAACTPTIQVQAPDKPIEINLNVKIEQEIRIKVDRELDDLFANNPDLF